MTASSDPTTSPPPDPRLVVEGLPPRRPIWRRLLKWALFAALVLANAAVVAAVAAEANPPPALRR